MTYSTLDITKPEPTAQNITTYSQSIRDNVRLIRDAVVAGTTYGWNFALTSAAITATISGTTMSVSAISSGQVVPGITLCLAGTTTALATIVAPISATNFGTGTYSLSASLTYASPTNFDIINADKAYLNSYKYTKTPEILLCKLGWDGSNNCTSVVWYYSASGSTWDTIGTETFTYDASNNLTSSTWS